MNFDQKIKYLDFYEGNVRVRGAGFLRLECWGRTCNLIMQVSGLFEKTKGNCPVMVCSGEQAWKIGEMALELGKGRLELRGLDCENLLTGEMEALPVRRAERFEVVLGGDRRLVATLGDGKARATKEETKEDGAVAKEEIVDAVTEKVEAARETVTEKVEAAQETKAEMTEAAQETKAEMTEAAQETVAEKVEPAQTPREYIATLKPGKWEQLTAIYPPIAPFGDGRKYLQISPGDFVILKDRSYRMVNNSFLLHGYFTYKHLILHKANRHGEAAYYVGVPGSFYGKEKEVAILFGFESFEGATEPAREGDFGYYMMRVEI